MPLRRSASILLAFAALSARAAWAWDVEIDSETIGQGYQLIGGDGGVITRRRLDQYLGLHVWNIGGKDALGLPLPKNQFYFTSSLRMEFELGDYARTSIGGRDVSPELGTNRFDLLYAYFGGRDVFGFVDLKLGRQIEFSLFEFTSFDGLSVDVKTPWHFALQGYAGLAVNGYLPIDSPVYRLDGTAPGVLSVHEEEVQPMVGVGARSLGLRDLDASFGYRRVYAPSSDVGAAGTPACTAPGADIRTLESCTGSNNGTAEEIIGAQARYRLLGGLLIPWAGFRYNLVAGLFDVVEAGVQANLSPRHALRAEYLYSYPTFDGDSIWNVFARRQFDDLRVGYDLRLGRLRAWARALVRLFHDVEEQGQVTAGGAATASASGVDGGGSVGARFELPIGYVRGDLYGEFGYGGTKAGADVSSRVRVWRDVISLEARLTYVHFADDLRPIDSGDSFGFQVGGRVSFWRGMLVHMLLEDNINRFYQSQLRFYALLDLAAVLGGYGFAAMAPRGIGPGLGQFASAYGPGRGY